MSERPTENALSERAFHAPAATMYMGSAPPTGSSFKGYPNAGIVSSENQFRPEMQSERGEVPMNIRGLPAQPNLGGIWQPEMSFK